MVGVATTTWWEPGRASPCAGRAGAGSSARAALTIEAIIIRYRVKWRHAGRDHHAQCPAAGPTGPSRLRPRADPAAEAHRTGARRGEGVSRPQGARGRG